MEKVNAPAVELILPATVWEDIFNHLNFDQLKQSRSTCRYWKSVIDGSHALMKRFHLVFPVSCVVDRHFYTPPTIPARSVTFERCRISSVGSWWTSLGEKLIHLTVKDCQISFPTLQKMLRLTPKLERLDYLCGNYPAVCISEGVPLERLTNLTVDNPCMDVLDTFGAMCPNLTHFALLQQSDKKKVLKFLKGKKDTLREIELTTLAYSLNVLLQIKQLTGLNIEHEVTSDEILCIIGNGLPHLKSIAVKMTKNTVLEPSFLATMPELENLSIKSRTCSLRQKLDLSAFKSPKLKHLSLAHVEPVGGSLKQFLSNSLDMSSVSVENCLFQNWKEFFKTVDQFKILKRLEIVRTNVCDESPYLFDVSLNWKHLVLINVAIPMPILRYTLSQCFQLKEIYLMGVKHLTDDVVYAFLGMAKQLEKLTIMDCKISKKSIELIEQHFLEVKCDIKVPGNVFASNN